MEAFGDTSFDLNTWGIQDRGEEYLLKTFPRLKRTGDIHSYVGFTITTRIFDGKIQCIVRKFTRDKDAIREFQTLISEAEDPDDFPSDVLIAKIALVVG